MNRTLAIFPLLAAGWALAQSPIDDRVHQRVAQIRASDTDSWRQVPWTATLLDAGRAAVKESRPMFVFSHEGNIDTGRC
jgi:hypothetical protein